MLSSSAPQRRTLAQALAEDVLQRIAEGAVRPGDRLPTEETLAAERAVSRSTARKAMQALVALGVAESRPGRGTVVLPLPSGAAMGAATVGALLRDQPFEDLYRLRGLLETEIAGKAAMRATPPAIAKLAHAHERCRSAHEADHAGFHLADLDFHRALATASGNPVYGNVLDALAELLRVSRRATGTIPEAVASAVGEHAAILDAVRAHDPAAARAAMRAHLESAVRYLAEAKAQGRLP